ncbi:MAG: DUF6350 family protein, partial [Bifidobacteriaceae bacterium]|nr:DUF6350 family protein [Bifidobacteriaceae bacterium]
AQLNDDVSWLDAARLGTDLWVVGHFGWTTLGEGATSGVLTMAPLGITLLSLLGCKVLAAVSSARGWPLLAPGVVGFAGSAAVLSFLLADAARPSAPAATVGAAAVATAGLLWGNAPHGNGKLLGGRIAAWLKDGIAPEIPAAVKAAKRAVGLMLLGAVLLTAAWVVGGAATFMDLFTQLDPGAMGGVALAGLCLAYTPNLVLWALSYIGLAGFHVGAGTEFSPFATTGGPLPSLPLFGLLPATPPPAAAWLVVLVPLLAGFVAGLRAQRRLPARPWWAHALVALAATLLAAAVLGGLAALSGGALGPGRLAQVGVNGALRLALLLGAELGCGLMIGALVLPRLTGRRGEPVPWTGTEAASQ